MFKWKDHLAKIALVYCATKNEILNNISIVLLKKLTKAHWQIESVQHILP